MSNLSILYLLSFVVLPFIIYCVTLQLVNNKPDDYEKVTPVIEPADFIQYRSGSNIDVAIRIFRL